MSSCSSFSILLGLPVRCLLVRVPLGYCAARFAVRSLLVGCRCLVMFLAWSLLILGLLMMVGMRMIVGRFTGLVVLVQEGKEFD